MAKFDIEFTKTYEEYDAAYRPIDRTAECVEKTRRDGDLVKIAVLALAAIIVVFLLVGALAIVKLEDLRRPLPSNAAVPSRVISAPFLTCSASTSAVTPSDPSADDGTSPTDDPTISDGSLAATTSESCSEKTDSSSSTLTEEKTPPAPSGESAASFASTSPRRAAGSMSISKAKPQRASSRLATSKPPVMWCRRPAW